MRGQDRVAVKALASKGQKRKNGHWADPCTEGAPIVRQDLSGRPGMLSRTRPVEKKEKKKEKRTRVYISNTSSSTFIDNKVSYKLISCVGCLMDVTDT